MYIIENNLRDSPCGFYVGFQGLQNNRVHRQTPRLICKDSQSFQQSPHTHICVHTYDLKEVYKILADSSE